MPTTRKLKHIRMVSYMNPTIKQVAKVAIEYLETHSGVDGITFYFCGKILEAYPHNTIQDIVQQYNKIIQREKK